MSHGSDAQEKSLSFECLPLLSEQSLLTEKCMLLIIKTFSCIASKPELFLSTSEEVKEDIYMMCLKIFFIVYQFVETSAFCLSKVLYIGQFSTGIVLNSVLFAGISNYYASKTKWSEV